MRALLRLLRPSRSSSNEGEEMVMAFQNEGEEIMLQGFECGAPSQPTYTSTLMSTGSGCDTHGKRAFFHHALGAVDVAKING